MQIKLPPTYADLNLRQLSVLMDSEEPFVRLEACSGLSLEELRKMPMSLINASNDHLTVLQEAETRKHLPILTLGGKEYGFIPDWEDFTAGEWIDLESYCEDFWSNSTKIMSVLYRPVTKKWGDKYDIEPYTTKEDPLPFERLSAELFSGCMLFFYNIRNELLSTMKSSLLEIAEKGTSSPRSGDGIPSYMDSRPKTYSVWTKCRHLLLDTYSHISLSSRT